ncbi:hypothetical protein [Allosalinactinospora lopnorensis]|uniref:hypothetical protein n=1 Tax=Allosalinactinospora lopnorensis TaxID=1352348 RepID=UPI000623E550|nr:hypothetical protein [Allosalinactinospora lopnorensis]
MRNDRLRELLADQGHPVAAGITESGRRFPDGSRYRVEIPSCEGPAVFEAVLEEAAQRDVTIDRVSQGSGVMMLSNAEIRHMAKLGDANDVEVNLFLGPRAGWDTGGQAKVTAAVAGSARGNAAVAASVNDALRACDLGIRSLLVGDLGTLAVLGELKAAGTLPAELVLKTSVVMPLTNGPTASLYERLGATSLNVSTDLDPATLTEVRYATRSPIDVYIEVPDDQGGAVRFYDVPDVIRAAAPVHLKFGVRNAPNIYPSGAHLRSVAVDLGRERVRRAALALELLADLDPDLLDAGESGQ